MLWPRPLQQLLRSIAPDVVHSHSGAWYKTALAARRIRARAMVHTEHGRPGPESWTSRLTERIASRWTNVVIAVSATLADALSAIVAPTCRVEAILNGVDTDVFSPGRSGNDWRDRLGLSPRTPVIGIIARLDPIKDFATLLEAVALLRRSWTASDPPVLVIAGDGPERANIAALVDKWALRGVVHSIGWVDAPVDLYPLFDVFTLSSRSEGTSIGLLEAMSCGVCPVVTAVGGNPAVLGPELSQLLVPAGAPLELANRWRSVLADRSSRLTLGRIGRERVRRLYSLDVMVQRYEALYARFAPVA